MNQERKGLFAKDLAGHWNRMGTESQREQPRSRIVYHPASVMLHKGLSQQGLYREWKGLHDTAVVHLNKPHRV